MTPTPNTGSDATVWLDGLLLAASDARISPFDHGLTVGDGLFETLKVIDGTPFALRRHLRRLERSAAVLGLGVPDPDQVRAAAREVIAANGVDQGRLRITLTGGPGPAGATRGTEGPTLLLTLADLVPTDHGAEVITVDWTRNERGALVGLKCTSYAENVLAMARAAEAGATEAIFANTVGNLCEGAGSNIFVGVEGRVVTPPLAAGCLPGVTRELVLEVTDAVEEDVPLEVLVHADEAFLTSSTRGVQGIRAVDGIGLGACPGPLTRAAADALADLVRQGLDP